MDAGSRRSKQNESERRDEGDPRRDGSPLHISSGGKSSPPRRIIRSRIAFAEPAAHSTIAHTAPNRQLRTIVCIDFSPPGIEPQNSRRTFHNR
jgi:hypothetical protein